MKYIVFGIGLTIIVQNYWDPSGVEMDLVGRIVDAAGLIADNPRVFDRVRETLLRIDTKPALTYRGDISNKYCKFNSVIKFIS